MSLKTRIKKLEKSVNPCEEMGLVMETIISDRREVLKGEAEPDEALGDRIEVRAVRVNPSSRV